MKLRLLLIIMAALLLSLLMACNERPSDLTVAGETQADVMHRAVSSVPAYRPQAFPARENINWYLQENEEASVWYVYAISMDGTPLFYLVSDMKPLNICVSITAPDRRVSGNNGAVVLSAPALDGVYYGGAGCDAYYVRDVQTSNFIELAGRTFTLISSKVPLDIETDWGRLSETSPDAEPAQTPEPQAAG